MSSIKDWSIIADRNSDSDNNINWREHQAPRTVNDSSRMMMSRIRAHEYDTSGELTSRFQVTENGYGQKTTIITLEPKRDISKYVDGLSFRFRAPSRNYGDQNTYIVLQNVPGDPVMLYVTGVYGLEPAGAGQIQKGGVYDIVYVDEVSEDRIPFSGWILLNPTLLLIPIIDDATTDKPRPAGPGIPTGLISQFGSTTLPEGWLLCDGKEYSREEYKELFDVIGTTWGSGDDTTTFNVPDFRGVFMRGTDLDRGFDHGREFATLQALPVKPPMKLPDPCPTASTAAREVYEWADWDEENYLVPVYGEKSSMDELTLDEWLDLLRRVPDARSTSRRVRRKGWEFYLLGAKSRWNFLRAALMLIGYWGEDISPARPELRPPKPNPPKPTGYGGYSDISNTAWSAYIVQNILSGGSIDDPAPHLPQFEYRYDDSSSVKSEKDRNKRLSLEEFEKEKAMLRSALDKPGTPMIPWMRPGMKYNGFCDGTPVNVSVIWAIKA